MVLRRNEFINSHALDAKWFLALKAIRRPLFLQSLGITSESYKYHYREFLRTPNYNPQFQYALSSVDIQRWHSVWQELDSLRRTIIQHEDNKSIATAYIEKIDELQLEMSILFAVWSHDNEEFLRRNKELYGELDPVLINDIKALLQKNQVKSFSVLGNYKVVPAPTAETFIKAKSVFATWPHIKISHQGVMNASEIQLMWQEALRSLGFNWQVICSAVSMHIRVDSKHKQIILPEELVVSAKKVSQLFAHEVGVHVFRREAGKQSTLQLLGIGLARYQTAEEGLCLMREQTTLSKFYSYAGFDKYLALVLATGLIDGVPRDFKTTFADLVLYYEERLLRRHSADAAHRIAKTRAWGSCYRIFIGGDTSVPGCCLYRDKMYREGNISMWQYFAKTNDFYLLSTGKFDPTIKNHVAIAELARPVFNH